MIFLLPNIDKTSAHLEQILSNIGINANDTADAFRRISEILAKEELSDLRSALDAKTENPNQKGDLENFSQIEVNPFLPGFVDLDSEDFLQQRPLWDFTVDF